MASVGWQVGAGGVPIPISSLSRTTYGKKSSRPGGKTRPALASVFPLRDVHESSSGTEPRTSPTRTLSPLVVPKRVKAADKADCVVLVSADGANFRVSRSVLAYASPAFHQLFSTLNATRALEAHSPASSSSSRSSVVSETDTLCLSNKTLADGTPIIHMPESGQTLDALLRYLYPFPPSPSELFTEQPSSLLVDKVKPVLLAAHKYSIRPILDEICGRLLSDLALPHDEEGDTFALRVYALACLVKRKNLAEAAAYEALRVPVEDVYFPELEEIPAVHYFRLLEYHRRCATSVLDLLASRQVSRAHDEGAEKQTILLSVCRECRTQGKAPESTSFWQSFLSRAEDLIRESPRNQRILGSEFVSETIQPPSFECQHCREEMLMEWKTASIFLKDEIERRIHMVDIDLGSLEQNDLKVEEKKEGRSLNVFHKFMTMR